MNLGAHMSIEGGAHLALERAKSIGCNAVQLFVKGPNRWKHREFTDEEIKSFKERLVGFHEAFVIAHCTYLVNLASPDKRLITLSRRGFLDEMNRAETLGIPHIVLHPGSHGGAGTEEGIKRVAESINHLFEQTKDYAVSILLETMAGQGNSLGGSFEELASIIELIDDKERIGVCLDTCHIFAAGYDIRSKNAYEKTIANFDEVIGLERLRAFHINDSLKPLGSKLDRHTHIGSGEIGLKGFGNLINDERFFDRPMVLETPKGEDLEMDKMNLHILRSLRARKR